MQLLLTCDLAQIRPHIEFDLCSICAARHHDGRIAYAASPELHVLLQLNLAIFDKA